MAWPWPNTDAIEEVQVLALGAPAEYGNVAGAIFKLVTRQGSNTFKGDINYYAQTNGLTGRNTTDAEDKGLPYDRDVFQDTTWQRVTGSAGQALVLWVAPVSRRRSLGLRARTRRIRPGRRRSGISSR